MPGRDRSRPWGSAEAGVTLLLEGITLRSDRSLVNDARKRAFAWRSGGARTCATTSVRRVVQVQAADDPNFSQLEWHQDGARTKVRNNSQPIRLRNQGEDPRRLRALGDLLARGIRRLDDIRRQRILAESAATCLDLVAESRVTVPGAGNPQPEEAR